jgi:hypothetical protein
MSSTWDDGYVEPVLCRVDHPLRHPGRNGAVAPSARQQRQLSQALQKTARVPDVRLPIGILTADNIAEVS